MLTIRSQCCCVPYWCTVSDVFK